MFFFKLELGHFGQLPTVAVGVLDELLSKFVCIDGLCPCLVECGVTILDAEAVFDDRADCCIFGDVGETHVGTVPFEYAVA